MNGAFHFSSLDVRTTTLSAYSAWHSEAHTGPTKQTPWSRVTQLVKELPGCYGTRRFIAVFTTARPLLVPFLI